MKRFLYFLAVLLVVLIILANYRVKENVYDPATVSAEDAARAENVTVNFTYDADIATKDVNDVKEALMLVPASVIKDFVDENWKLIITNNMEETSGSVYTANSYTDFRTRTIQIKPAKYASVQEFTKLQTIREMCRFADKFTYHMASDSESFKALYEEHKDNYIEYELVDSNTSDTAYATSSEDTFFACSMKDFLVNPQYLLDNYSDVYAYFDALIRG